MAAAAPDSTALRERVTAFQVDERPAIGRPVRAARCILVTTAELVHGAPDGTRRPCAVMQQTLVPVPKTH